MTGQTHVMDLEGCLYRHFKSDVIDGNEIDGDEIASQDIRGDSCDKHRSNQQALGHG